MVISASRRTDLPAWYGRWFRQRLEEGFARYTNPFSGTEYQVSLTRESVIAFLFWSKDFAPFMSELEHLEELGYPFYCHFTITGLPVVMEPAAPPWSDAVECFAHCANRFGPHRMCWRFDPIVLTSDISSEDTVRRFAGLAERLAGYTESCHISFVDAYRKVKSRLAALSVIDPPGPEMSELAERLAEIASGRGMQVYACCEPSLVSSRIAASHCLDLDLLRRITGNPLLSLPRRPTREGCGCFASRDIGAYDTCPSGCAYCYANTDMEKARRHLRSHQPDAPNLLGTATRNE
ncbi:DUF1848 domain-containing protein [bacterium]|nr:DUF1848 domain-containing protein [candidate division CSSED10-310 bacterium]